MNNSALHMHPRNTARRPHSAFWWRIGGLLVLVMSVVLLLISFLNYSNYRKTYLELNLTRYLVMAKDLRQTVESGLNIGRRPSENLQLLPMMQAMENRRDGIRYVGVITDT